LTPSQSQKRLAWTRGKLVLMGEPLRDVVREINRYHRQKLVIADPALEQTEVGGVIDPATYDYRVIIRALGSRCPIVFDDSDPAVLVLRRSQAPECEASR
jgi:ferric-dicitrate binding protein FerR (iron transport regulator)